MARPKTKRLISQFPVMEGFRPFGIPANDLEPVVLLFEEYEVIRLLDYLGMTQAEAARELSVSRPTLTRIYAQARRAIAGAFVEGKAIFIGGGDYHTDEFWYRCEGCHRLLISEHETTRCSYCRSPRLKSLSAKERTVNPVSEEEGAGKCICPGCGTAMPHKSGVPCRESRCPACGKRMIRENSYHHKLYINKKGLYHENRDSQ